MSTGIYSVSTIIRLHMKVWNTEEAINLIKLDSRIFFDPALIDLFLEFEDEFEK